MSDYIAVNKSTKETLNSTIAQNKGCVQTFLPSDLGSNLFSGRALLLVSI